VEVLCYDIKEHVGDANAKQVSLKELQKSRCAELAYSWTPETNQMVDAAFVDALQKSFWVFNTSRGIM
jgi:D-3-phosphoglycerate dehydrogenase